MCVKDTGTKYQLWISDFNIDGTFTRVHPFIISHTKTMTRTREDGKEEVFSACIKPDDARYLGGNKSSSVVATKLQGRPRTGINYDKATDKAVRVLLLGGCATDGSGAGSGGFDSTWIRSGPRANVGFFTTVKLD